MFQVFHEDVPNIFDNFVTYNYTIHEQNTRGAHICNTLACLKLDKNWNKIPKAYHMEQYH